MIALLAAAHLYLFPEQHRALFLLPASEKACGLASLRYGPSDGKWERGSNIKASSCEFRVHVMPGPLLPSWVDDAPPDAGEVEVTYTMQGAEKAQVVSLKAETLGTLAADGAGLTARAQKVKDKVRVEVTNKGDKPVLLGDAAAARSRPRDACLGPGPAAVLQPGETLVDVRPGLLSKSMQVWLAVFTSPKTCKWVEARRAP
jgi:hypothetical protein